MTGDEYKKIRKEKGISKEILRTLKRNMNKEDNSTYLVIGFYPNDKNKVVIGYGESSDSISLTKPISKIIPKENNKNSDFRLALDTLKAASEFEKNYSGKISYRAPFPALNSMNCNSSQTGLNEAAGGMYENNLKSRQALINATRFSGVTMLLTTFGITSLHGVEQGASAKYFKPKDNNEK